jgi:hypothetical protein
MDGGTLRQMADRASKEIDIGAAVLPGPLFKPDVEDYDSSDELRDDVASLETHYARVLRQEFICQVKSRWIDWDDTTFITRIRLWIGRCRMELLKLKNTCWCST